MRDYGRIGNLEFLADHSNGHIKLRIMIVRGEPKNSNTHGTTHSIAQNEKSKQ